MTESLSKSGSSLVNLQNLIVPASNQNSWADQSAEEFNEPVEAPKKKAWGDVPKVQAAPVGTAEPVWPTDNKSNRNTSSGGVYRPPERRGGANGYNQYDRHDGAERNWGQAKGERDDNSRFSRSQYRGSGDSRPPRRERTPPPFPTSPPYTAFVSNLPFDATEDDIFGLFSELSVSDIRIMRRDNRPSGYGYVDFKEADSLRSALDLQNLLLKDREVKVSIAAEKTNKNDRSERDRDRGERRSNGASQYWSTQRTARQTEAPLPTERKKIVLNPRSENPSQTASTPERKIKENPFGGASPSTVNIYDTKPKSVETPEKKEPATTKSEPRSSEPAAQSQPSKEVSWRNRDSSAQFQPRSNFSRNKFSSRENKGRDNSNRDNKDKDSWHRVGEKKDTFKRGTVRGGKTEARSERPAKEKEEKPTVTNAPTNSFEFLGEANA